MRPVVQACGECAAFGLRALGSFALWSLWLALALLLAAQVTIFVRREAEVPAWLRESIAGRAREAGLHARFGRTVFDSTGRIHIEHLELASAAEGPVLLRVRSLLVRLDPWALLRGQLEASAIDLAGGQLIVPAFLSPTGADEPLLDDLAFAARLDPGILAVDSFTARRGRTEIVARGDLVAAALSRPGAAPPRPLASWIADYPRAARRILEFCTPSEDVEGLRLSLELRRGSSRTQEVRFTAEADAGRFEFPRVGAVMLRELRLTAQSQFALTASDRKSVV